MGEVDELDDAVDHRVAERDEREDRPLRCAVDELLENEGCTHSRRPPLVLGRARPGAFAGARIACIRRTNRVGEGSRRRVAAWAATLPHGITAATRRGGASPP